jgi:hypothetical protein
MDVPPAGPDASSSGADSLVAAVADASQTRIDAPAVQTAAPGPRDASPDGADGASLAQADVSAATEDAGSLDDASPDSAEASRPSCMVTFTVAEAWIDGVVYTDVALGGDAAALGAWNPAAAVTMTEVASGTWTAGVMLTDAERVEFLFVKRGPNVTSWESWAPNSDRSLVVACAAASGIVEAGAVEGGSADAGPVVGVSYVGNFNVQPPDSVEVAPGSP